jgi:hypothetical protein
MKKIKEALEEALEITPQDKYKKLQRLKIKRGESIKNFNWRYKKLYNNLPKFYQSLQWRIILNPFHTDLLLELRL